MNLFAADLASISLRDVEEFLAISSPEPQRPPEGTKIDYKLKEPADLCNTVAAFANTAGGLIFIGVESKRLKHNVPISIPGDFFAGGDVKARLIGKIVSQVSPRPDVQIGVVQVASHTGAAVAVIRVSEGTFPPYEFSLSDSVRIPIRLQDTNRQATLRDLEHLFEKRRTSSATPDQRLEIFDETRPLLPSFITELFGDTEKSIRPNAYQTWLVRPRSSLHLRLDRAFDMSVRNTFPAYFIDSRLGNFWPPIMTGDSHVIRWQARVSDETLGALTLARAIEFKADGSIRFTEKLDRHESGDESISDLFFLSLRFLRFARDFYLKNGHSGSTSIAQRIDCPSPIRLYRTFPDENGQYHSTNAIAFLGQESGRASGSSRASREISGLESSDLETLVCDFMLGHLRELCSASIDYGALREIIQKLPNVPGLAFF